MNGKTAQLTADQWTSYWRKSSITALTRAFNQNYDQEFKQFWDDNFASLPRDAVVVDLATGNGAVALLAAEFARDHGLDFTVLGLDFADIRPSDDLAKHEEIQDLIARVDFRGGILNEETQLPDSSVDLLTSQYGFEYGDIPASIPEAWRVLKPGGAIALITHHTESRVVELAADGTEQLRLCMQKEKLDHKIVALIKAMGDVTTAEERRTLKNNPKTESLRKKLNATVARLNARADGFKDPEGFLGSMIPGLMNVFAKHRDKSMDEKLKYVRGLRREFDAFQQRMADLREAAVSPKEMDAVRGVFEQTGFSVEQLRHLNYGPEQHMMGWAIVARKPKAA